MRTGSAKSHSRGLRGALTSIVAKIESDASTGISIKNGAQAREIVGIKVVAKATSASGSVTVSTPEGAVATVDMAAADAVAEATALANTTLGAFEEITFTANGAADRGTVIVETIEL